MANNEEDDKELNDYLRGDPDLSNNYRKSNKMEPPSHLDTKILFTAKEMLNKPRQKQKLVFHKSPWALPVSIAAVITLSVSLIATMQQETGQPLLSEPEIELYDSVLLYEEATVPQAKMVNGDVSIVSDSEQRSKEDGVNSNMPASVSSSATGGSRAESEPKRLKDELKPQLKQKALLKEKTSSITSEKQALEKEQLLQSAPAGIDEITGLKRERQSIQQENELLTIKAFWGAGDLENAKQAYRAFTEKYPGFSLEKIIEVLGPELFQTLNK